MMAKYFKAIYENGVFRPLEAVALPEHQEVTLAVHEDDHAAANAKDTRNAYDLAQELGLIGLIANAPANLSTNKAHFQGFGGE